MQCRPHSRRLTSECLFVTACSTDEYAEEKRTEQNLILRSGISEAETTNNKRLRSTFCVEAIQTQSDSRASCYQSTARLKRIEHNLIIHIRKSKAEVTNNKRHVSKYCTAEATKRRAASLRQQSYCDMWR